MTGLRSVLITHNGRKISIIILQYYWMYVYAMGVFIEVQVSLILYALALTVTGRLYLTLLNQPLQLLALPGVSPGPVGSGRVGSGPVG